VVNPEFSIFMKYSGKHRQWRVSGFSKTADSGRRISASSSHIVEPPLGSRRRKKPVRLEGGNASLAFIKFISINSRNSSTLFLDEVDFFSIPDFRIV